MTILRAAINADEIQISKRDRGLLIEDKLATEWKSKFGAELTDIEGFTKNFDGSKLEGKRFYTLTESEVGEETFRQALEEAELLENATRIDCSEFWQAKKDVAIPELRKRGYDI